MKKRLLFVMNNLNCGGAEKALVSLLASIDYSQYEVDLFLFKHEGLFMTKVPNEVKILPEPRDYKYFDMPIKESLKALFIKGKLKSIVSRCVMGYLAKTETNGAVIEQKIWWFLRRSLIKLPNKYDVAIGFQEKNPIYFCIDNVDAEKKIGWVHTDYNKLGINEKKESRYFGNLDYIVTVSEELVNILKGIFPQNKDKIQCVYNVISSQVVRTMSLEPVRFFEQGLSIISVGRLAKEKGLDITLEAFNLLIRKGYDLTWYIIGEGNMRSHLEQRVEELNLKNKVIFLGQQANPYPFIKEADIYIQTSRYEGRSISIEEAKILGKPILITNFETATDHIKHKMTGMIAEMNAMSVADHLEELICDESLRKRLSNNLTHELLGTENEIEKLYNIISN